MSGHSQKSPSRADRFHKCPGVLALLDILPACQRGQSSEAADRGTAAHALLERCLKNDEPAYTYLDGYYVVLDVDRKATILRKADAPAKANKFYVDADMADGVELAREYVVNRCGELRIKRTSLALEAKTNPLPDRDDTGGTADVTIDAWPECLEVIDYKNGRVTVEHEDNPQLLAYLLGQAKASSFDYSEYRISVVQPNAFHEEGRARSYAVSKERLLEFEKEHRAACEKCDEAALALKGAALDDWAKDWLSAGDHCKWCEAGICPARRELMQEQTLVSFDAEPVDMPVPDMHTALRVMRWAKQIKAHITAAEKYVENALLAGESVQGARLERKTTNRVWRGDMTSEGIVKALVTSGYLGEEESRWLYKDRALVTGPQAEKMIPVAKRKEFAAEFLTKPVGEFKAVIDE